MWMSAYLDGELSSEESEKLFDLVANNQELQCKFDEMMATVALSQKNTASFESRSMTDHVMVQIAPETLESQSVDLLASALVDNELSPKGTERFESILSQKASSPENLNASTLAFLDSHDLLSSALESSAGSTFVRKSVSAIPQNVERSIIRDERASLLFSAYLDCELDAHQEREFKGLVADGHLIDGLDFGFALEGLGAYLRESQNDPMAQRAGAAALQAIAAYNAQENVVSISKKPREETPSLTARIRDFFATATLPGLVGASALALVVFLGNQNSDTEPVQNEWLQENIATAVPPVELSDDSAALNEVFDSLLANNHADVQDLDTGSQVSAVFDTEASHITVIWLSEPEEEGT